MSSPGSKVTLRFGMIGASGHFGGALNVIARHPQLSLAAVALAHPSERLERVRSHPAFTAETRVVSSPEELLDDGSLAGVVINPPYGMNARYAIAAVRRGIAVYVEKPYATRLDELEELRRAASEHKTPLTGMLELRAHPVIATAARLVRGGAIGAPTLAYGQKTYKFDPATRPPWYADEALYGGTIPWVAIHAIDWTRFITGCEYTAVTGVQSSFGAGPLATAEKAGGLLFELTGGGAALISFDYLRPAAAATHGDDRFRIIGTEGELWGSVQRNELRLLDRSGERLIELDPTETIFERFVGSLLDPGRPTPVTAEDGIASTEAALWARQAARLRARVVIPQSRPLETP